MQNALQLADWKDLRLHRPFVNLTKAELVRIGAKLGAPHLFGPDMQEKSHCGKRNFFEKEAFDRKIWSYRICLNSYSVHDYLQDLS